MSQRKVWTSEEDAALLEILKARKIKKWKDVARTMEEDYNIPGRSGKQCRQRWHNQLDPNINNHPWSASQEQKLFQLHNTFGNKWAKIAKGLPGRTDNCIKNHFYSTLRKAVRKLNRFISQTRQKGEMKEIKPIILSKIIVVSGERWDKKAPMANQLIQRCISIKKRLIYFAKQAESQAPEEEDKMRALVGDIMEFHKLYKKRKTRKVKKTEQKPVKSKNKSEQEEAEQSNVEEDSDQQLIDNDADRKDQTKIQQQKIEHPKNQKKQSLEAPPEAALRTPSHNVTSILQRKNTSYGYPCLQRNKSFNEEEYIMEREEIRVNSTKQLFGASMDQFLQSDKIEFLCHKPSEPPFEFLFQSSQVSTKYFISVPEGGIQNIDTQNNESLRLFPRQSNKS